MSYVGFKFNQRLKYSRNRYKFQICTHLNQGGIVNTFQSMFQLSIYQWQIIALNQPIRYHYCYLISIHINHERFVRWRLSQHFLFTIHSVSKRITWQLIGLSNTYWRVLYAELQIHFLKVSSSCNFKAGLSCWEHNKREKYLTEVGLAIGPIICNEKSSSFSIQADNDTMWKHALKMNRNGITFVSNQKWIFLNPLSLKLSAQICLI